MFLNEVTKHVFIHFTVTKVHLWPPKGYYLCQGTIKNFQWRHYFTWILTLSHREQWRWLARCAARLDSVWTAGCLVGPVAVVWGDGTVAARGTCTKEGFQKTVVNHVMRSPRNPGNKVVPNFLTWLTLKIKTFEKKKIKKLFLQLRSSNGHHQFHKCYYTF